ncbi:MAG: SLBB domain-containing protein [Candidatus Omnitrophica bacterium]|nr:SLBB domain-containing protein [Candidatus Omnitrophota bacterium]
MKRLPILILNLAIFLLANSAFSFAQESKDVGKEYRVSSTDILEGSEKSAYKITPNDLLEISVYDEPDLTKTVRVGADRIIIFPLLGTVSVKGLTPKELETKLTDLLQADYLITPQVSVLVKERAKIAILGQVSNPGQKELSAGMTLLDAIVQAGGFTDVANILEIKLIRSDDNDNKGTLTFDASEIFKEGGNKTQGIFLQPGDLIIVGKLRKDEESFIVVFGEVEKPGRYELNKDMTVIEAVALAGGLKSTAAGDGTKIIRTQNGQRKTINVRLASILKGYSKGQDISLEPGDVIMVPESFF